MKTHELADLLYKLPNREVVIGDKDCIITYPILRIDSISVRETDLRPDPRPFFVLVPEIPCSK